MKHNHVIQVTKPHQPFNKFTSTLQHNHVNPVTKPHQHNPMNIATKQIVQLGPRPKILIGD